MGSGTFRGGIHPYDGKELSRDRAIQDIRPGKELAYLVSQHIGAISLTDILFNPERTLRYKGKSNK